MNTHRHDEWAEAKGLPVIRRSAHMGDIFLIEPGTDRFRGNLCRYGQCPKGKPECAVPGCGAQLFLQVYEGFRLYRDALDGEHNVVLFDRAAASSPSAASGDDTPF